VLFEGWLRMFEKKFSGVYIFIFWMFWVLFMFIPLVALYRGMPDYGMARSIAWVMKFKRRNPFRQ
jgi:hypothetical protein